MIRDNGASVYMHLTHVTDKATSITQSKTSCPRPRRWGYGRRDMYTVNGAEAVKWYLKSCTEVAGPRKTSITIEMEGAIVAARYWGKGQRDIKKLVQFVTHVSKAGPDHHRS